MNSTDAHSNEYLAAITGMQDTYGKPRTLPAVGDFISGVSAGKRWSGHVEWYSDDGKTVTVNVDHSWVSVPVSDITH